jgi:hypothetical protein
MGWTRLLLLQISGNGSRQGDVMLIPKDVSQVGIILEFKKARGPTPEDFQKATDQAMKQIKDRGYAQELMDLGIEKILFLAIALRGKDAVVVSKMELKS